MSLVWSEMLTRQVWGGVADPAHVDKARKKVNGEVTQIFLDMGIQHRDIRYNQLEIFGDDDICSSDGGAATWLQDVMEWIVQEL